jgi:feruloyl esterase
MLTSGITVSVRGCIGKSASLRLVLSLAAVIVGASAAQADDCVGLKGQTLGWNEATITDAVVVPTTDKQPEHCRVLVRMNDSTLRFESRLPISGWNGKLVFLGSGGFRGALFDPDRPFFSTSIRADHYATMVTNGGYDYPTRDAGYFQANFAYDPVKLVDFTYLSEHRALPFGKELIRKFYGAGPSKSYFEGCSSGGHDAMMLSQRWRNDFDGIIARAPAGPAYAVQPNRQGGAHADRDAKSSQADAARQGSAGQMRQA